MEPTKALRQRLRKMINDVIPKDGKEEEVSFSDAELDSILQDSSNIYYAASELWTLKASMLEGEIESYSAGNEKYDLTKFNDRLSHYLMMAHKYKEKSDSEENVQGSILFKFKAPDVM